MWEKGSQHQAPNLPYEAAMHSGINVCLLLHGSKHPSRLPVFFFRRPSGPFSKFGYAAANQRLCAARESARPMMGCASRGAQLVLLLQVAAAVLGQTPRVGDPVLWTSLRVSPTTTPELRGPAHALVLECMPPFPHACQLLSCSRGAGDRVCAELEPA
jgi:hypothetical protein